MCGLEFQLSESEFLYFVLRETHNRVVQRKRKDEHKSCI